MKKRVFVLFAVLVLVLAGCATAPQPKAVVAEQKAEAAAAPAPAPKAAPNVIFLLTDGTGPEAWPLVRWIKGAPLAVDEILTGAIRTYGADSIITDSAPGATAYATGYKGTDKGISVGAWNVTIDAAKPDTAPKYVPLATLIEGAKVAGRAVGLIATSNVQHATPAAFSSHWHDRNIYNELAEQQVYQAMDVVLSGGLQYLLPKEVKGGKREDKENLVDVLKSKGYSFITTRDELLATKSGKVWGMFAPDAMAWDIDRDEIAQQEPSLAEMTGKAIELLSARGKPGAGFFLFVEGSKVDWAAHADDPAGLVSDLLAFDDAVKTALDFAKKDGNTLVIVVADHGTGGVTIGAASDKNYSQTDDDLVVVPMRKIKMTAEGMEKLLAGDSSEQAIRKIFAEQWGMLELAADDIKAIQAAMAAKTGITGPAAAILSKQARIGWTTGGHTGADVFLFAYGPDRPTGLWQNTGIGRLMAKEMGFDFESLNKRLFVEAEASFSAVGLEARLDKTDPANPVLVVQKGESKAELPLSKNLLLMNGKTVELEGIVVLAEKLGKVYLPKQAVDLVAAGLGK
ncbi:MAG: alkaline phosphatase [Acidobacteria bacterium]|nr:alkaline phosphatase [Acidobacteriota bacterium]